ncbi:hypothetical protein [Sphingobacterium sp. UBA5670]|uniref:hypothetical protein n=1 Tax=Sphingobacterium sp. UBA5670 TaxID=1947502 RepID=UPI0025F5D80E|nr:hypothetical protein [Sphingobacterium sp. UBA5670]
MKQKNSLLKNLAGGLGRRTARLSFFQQKLLLVVFLIPLMLYCTFLLLGGAKGSLSFSQINVPIMTSSPEQQQLNKEMIALNKYLDSLTQTAEGKILLDSLYKARPTLLDSINEWKDKVN